MREGHYDNPKYPVEKRAKILCVICTYVPVGGYEMNCPGLSSHNHHKKILYAENKIDTVKFNLACHKHYKPGVDYEIAIVDNESPEPEFRKYLRELVKEGYKVYKRPNVGFSFGAFQWAWKQFGRKYDYYLFCEQDGVPAKDNWLRDVLVYFHGEPNVGAVGNFVESRTISESKDFFRDMAKACSLLKDRDWMCNFDGFFSFTSSTVLEECNGPFVFDLKGQALIEARATWNELCFHQPILEAGYKLISYFDLKHILWKGQYVLDHDPRFDRLPLSRVAPLVLAHPRLLDPRARELFKWYGTEESK